MANEAVTMAVLLLLLFLSGLLYILLLLRSKKGDGKCVPSGSMGWPLIGETISFYLSMTSSTPQQFISERQRRYGKIFASHMYGRRVIVSTDHEFNKYLLQNEGRVCRVCYTKGLTDLFGKYGMICIHGDLHRKLHGIAVSLIKLENLRTHFIEDIQIIIKNSLSTWDGKNIILQKQCHKMNLKLMAKHLLGLSTLKETDELDGLYADFTGALMCLPLKIPGSAYAKGHQARKLLIKKIFEIIKQRRDQPNVEHSDLLTKLLLEYSLPDDVVADFLLFMLFAGHETSSRAMALSVKYLTHCPRALNQLRDEHEALLKTKGCNERLTWDDYKSMKFTQCVIKETLRLASIAASIERKTLQDVEIKGYHIPKGSVISLFWAATHWDETLYLAPFTFHPWRWELHDIKSMCKEEFLTPFGGGGRLCPGAQLAKLQISIFLHHFVTRFRWNVIIEDKISYWPMTHLVKGLPIQVYSRE